MAKLREHQQTVYGKAIAFCVVVITRWSTRDRLFVSIIRNKEALRRYLESDSSECSPDISSIINDTTFWATLDDIRILIHPISELQQMSESSKSHIGQVHGRWKRIEDHISNTTKTLTTFTKTPSSAAVLVNLFTTRRAVQTSDIHIAAYWLDPTNIKKTIPQDEHDATVRSIELYAGREAREKFSMFCGQYYPYDDSNTA